MEGVVSDCSQGVRQRDALNRSTIGEGMVGNGGGFYRKSVVSLCSTEWIAD